MGGRCCSAPTARRRGREGREDELPLPAEEERVEGAPGPAREEKSARGRKCRREGQRPLLVSRGPSAPYPPPPLSSPSPQDPRRRRPPQAVDGAEGALHKAMASDTAQASMDPPMERSSHCPLLLPRVCTLKATESPPVPHPTKVPLEDVRRGGVLSRCPEVDMSCCSRWVSSRPAAEAACAGGAAPPPSPMPTVEGGRPPLTLPCLARGSR